MKRLVRPFFKMYFMFIILALTLGSLILLLPVKAFPSSFHNNPISQENQKSGTRRWQSAALQKSLKQQNFERDSVEGRSATTSDAWTDTSIRGYANATSINKGEAINLYVGTTLPSYTIEIYRMGWYGGTGSRLIQTISNLPGQNQPIPPADPTTGLLQLNWNVSFTLQTGTDWVTGVYMAKLIGSDGTVAYIPFVVRDDSSTADIVYQVPLTTYQAYNNWGGQSLYGYNSTNGTAAYKVSFDRPYAGSQGTGLFFQGDYAMIRFLESKGYNITYVTSVDTQVNPNLMNGHKVFLSNYHDEYWSKPMRDNITNALSQGKNLAFFGANNIYWQIRFETATSGVANRVIVCYRDATLDPISQTDPSLTSVRWRDNPVNQPENALLGVMFDSSVAYPNAFPWVVTNANYWVYNGTGLNNGDSIPNMVGYEWDRVYNNGLTPAGLITLSASPVTDSNQVQSIANSGIYTASSNGLVFTAGTIFWSWKVDDQNPYNYPADSRVQLMTTNILNTMISGVRGCRFPFRHTGIFLRAIPWMVAQTLFLHRSNLDRAILLR